MVVLNDTDMYSCRVLYIGSAPPVETLKGIEALQEPLRQRFPINVEEIEGIDAYIRVLPTDLEVTYVESGQTLHFPLSRLTICAGVTPISVTDATTGEKYRQFVPVNTVQHDSRNPAIFAAIIRRSQGRQIAECHMFVCKSTRDALHLVNATATANMALKQQKHGIRHESSSNENDVVVIKADVVEAPQNGYMTSEGNAYGQSEEVYVKSDSGPPIEPRHYKIQATSARAPSPETIYISFDKSNLVSTDRDTLEVRSQQRAPSPRHSPRPPSRQYLEVPAHSYRPITPPPPSVLQPQQVMIRRPLPIPPPRPVIVRPQPMMVRAPPQPVMVRAPPPPPMIVRAPPQPVMVRAPPPPRPVLVSSPPLPQRMYTKRMVAVPPPPTRYVTPAPINARTRARSASPSRAFSDERRSRREGQYQPKWEGPSRRPASDAGFRMSRRDQFDHQSPPRDFRQSQNMFINERAFSKRVYADGGMTGMPQGYGYPYDYGEVVLYDRPTTKSNPRYSSSSDSDDGRDNRMSKSYRR